MTGDSELDKTDLRTSVISRSGSGKESRQSLLRFAERRYKKSALIRSYSQVDLATGTINRSLRLRLTLPEKTKAVNGSALLAGPTACNYESIAPSPVLDAWGVQQQAVEGCFHAELAGVYPRYASKSRELICKYCGRFIFIDIWNVALLMAFCC